MIRRSTSLVVVAIALLLVQWSQGAELYVRVVDQGKPVAGLTAENFRVVEGGRGRTVVQAEPAGPASVVLLVENSETSWRYLSEVNSAMRGFLKAAPSGHQYSLVSFSLEQNVEATLSAEAERVVAAYAGRKQSTWSYVAAYDALDQVLDALRKVQGLRVVVMVGAGEDSFSRASFRDVIRRLETENVVVYSLQLGGSAAFTSDGDGADLHRGGQFMQAIAQRSGGERYCPNCEAGYRTAVEEVLDSLATFYRLQYDGEDAPKDEAVELSVEAFRLNDDVRHDYRVKAKPVVRFSAR
jgi:VWFA-related protein